MSLLAYTLRRTARRAAIGGAAFVFLLAGAGFLLSAAWLAIAASKGALFASLILGLGLAGIGLVLLAAALMRPAPPTAPELDAATLAALQQAAAGGPGDLERAMRGLLSGIGLPPPTGGSMPSLLAALVFGVTLALSQKRRR